MRKPFALLTLLSLLLVFAFPALAQDDETNTIADIVIASATAEEAPEFTVLLAAVEAADPVFLDVLTGELPVTVFAPTDAAFTDLLDALEISAEDLLADTDLLNEVLAYHVVPGFFPSGALVQLGGAYKGTFLHHEVLQFSDEGEDLLINDSGIIDVDIEADNGVIHVIDTVLLPPAEDDMMDDDMEGDEMMEEMGTIADIVIASTEAEEAEFTILLAAVQNAEPLVLDLLTGYTPYTVFAPTDAAFEALLEEMDLTADELLADTGTLTTILSYHLVPGWLTAEDLVGLLDGAMEMDMEAIGLATPLGQPIEFDGEFVNEAALVTTDIIADNGVIHVIDTVLVPEFE